MIVVRFKVTCKPDRAEDARAAFEAVVAPSRAVDGVLSFDIGRDVTDRNSFIATEVFADRTSLERQEALPVVQQTIALLDEVLAAPPEATIYHVTSSEAWES